MSRREYELMFRLNGEMSAAFRNSFRNASSETRALQNSMRELNSQMGNIKQYQRQQSAIQQSQQRLERLQQAHDDLAQSIANTENPSSSLLRRMEQNERQIQITTERIEEQRNALQEMSSALEAAGVDTNDLEAETEQLQQAYSRLEGTNRFIQDIGSALDENNQKLKTATSELGIMAGAYAAVIGSAYAATGEQAKDFESAFAGVQKTVDGTPKQLEEIKKGIKELSQTEVIAAAEEIAAVAENAGQLGIQTENILSFSKVMTDLGESTNLTSEQAASDLAKFANVTKMSQDKFSNLGSTIVDLGNNFATTEADIVSMGTRLASTGELTGLNEAEIMGFATALSSLGIEAEAGGTAAAKLLKQIETAFATRNKDEESLKKFKKYADIAGMTVEEFEKLYSDSNISAIAAFTKGLTDEQRNGKGAIEILDEMGITEVRLSNAVLALASSDDILTEAVELANKAWEENTALTIEAEKRYATTESRMDMAKNSVENLGIALGDIMLPYLKEGADDITELSMRAQRWVDENGDTIESTAKLALEIGGAALAVKGLQVGYLALNSAGLVAVKGIGRVVGAVQSASFAASGSRFSRFMSSLTGIKANAAGFVTVSAGMATALAAVTIGVLAYNKAVIDAGRESIDDKLFGNGLPTLKEYEESLKDNTSRVYEFAQGLIDASDNIEAIDSNINTARDSLRVYGDALREDGIISPEDAHAMKQPFIDLISYLDEEFEQSYNIIFDDFINAVGTTVTGLDGEVAAITRTLNSFKAEFDNTYSKSEDRVGELLAKEELTAEDEAELEKLYRLMFRLSDDKAESLSMLEEEVSKLKGVDLGENQEIAIKTIESINAYAQDYLTTLDSKQVRIKNEHDTFRNQSFAMLEEGLWTGQQYDAYIDNLTAVEAISYNAYKASRDDFTDDINKIVATIRNQLESSIREAVSTKDIGEINPLYNQFEKGKLIETDSFNSELMGVLLTKGYEDSLRAGYSDLETAMKDLEATISEKGISVRDAVGEYNMMQYHDSIAFNPADPYNLAQYSVGTKNAESYASYDPSAHYKQKHLTGYASGTRRSTRTFIAGEYGPEIITDMPASTVYTAEETADILDSYQTIMSAMPQFSGLHTPLQSTGGDIHITVQSNPVFNGASGDMEQLIERYNDDLTAKLKAALSELMENERRNAYS